MIESWGPVTIDLADTSRKMGLALQERSALKSKKTRQAATSVSSLEEAASKFHSSIITESPMELASAKVLVARNLRPSNGTLVWTYDHKLKLRGVLAPSEEQVLVAIRGIKCPVLMIEGERGFLRARYGGSKKAEELKNRKETFGKLRVVVLPGAGHYPHLDSAKEVASLIQGFLFAGK